jgi:Kef-type K+ transport system membrane component KefB/nucleotide-binding universal stress UspA family protein
MHLSPAALLLLQVLLIVGTSRLMGRLFRILRQPQVVAEILAGLALGPTLLGVLAPSLQQTLFPEHSLHALHSLSDLGLTLFLFVVGLEFEPHALRRQGKLAGGVSLGALLLPFAMGVSAAWLSHPHIAPEGTSRLAFSLFIGTAISVTAFPVLARIVAERGLLQTTIGSLAMTAAAVADVLAWCLLALSVVLAQGGSWQSSLLRLLLVGLFVGGMLGAVRPLLARLAIRYGRLHGLTPGATATVLLALLGSSLLSELIGIHALFGAFLFGTAVPRQGRLVPLLLQPIEPLVVLLFLPVYFASVGLKTDLSVAVQGGMLSVTLGVLVLAVFGKLVGVLIPARLGRLPWRDSWILGILMNTRGLMEFVILGVGLDMGLIDRPLFAAMVIMALATTLMTTPLVSILRPARSAARLSELREDDAYSLVVCAAHDASVDRLATLASLLCGPGDARSYALSLEPLGEHSDLVPTDDTGQGAERTARILAEQIEARGALSLPISFSSPAPVRDIIQITRAKKADMILLGFHIPMVGHAVLGGLLREIANAVDSDVLMLHREVGEVSRVVVGLGGAHDAGVRRVAARLRRRSLHITEIPASAGLPELLRQAAEADLLVVGVGHPFGPTMSRLGLQRTAVVDQTRCALLVVSAGSPAA